MKRLKRLKRTLSVVLSAALVLQMGFTPAMAGVPAQTTIIGGNLCEHHQHTADCGYTEGTACTFTKEQCEICTPKDSGGMPALGMSSTTVTGFDPQDSAVTQRVVSVGTTLDELNLPATLGAMGYTVTADTEVVDSGTPSNTITPAAIRIEGVAWVLTPAKNVNAIYNPLLGTYCFSPILPAGYTLAEGVALPELWVRVGDKARKTAGAFTIEGGESDTDYTYAAGAAGTPGMLTIRTDKPLTIKNTDSAVATADRIVVKSGITANLTLNGVNIVTAGLRFHPLAIHSGATANLTLDGTNTLKTTGKFSAGIHVPTGATLTIDGSGSLTATGGGSGTIIINGGTVTAQGGITSAGIGSSSRGNVGEITINGGRVTATGGSDAAGIGSGITGSGITGSGGKITIKGGEVIATSARNGAGIGGGKITISGTADVTATGGKNSAGIGGGGQGTISSEVGESALSGDGGEITISGGTVEATGGMNGAGIGGGKGGNGGTIAIKEAAEVTTTGGEYGAGIGGGSGNGGKITISGGTVNAKGGMNGAGIGGGDSGSGGEIAIKGGKVDATSSGTTTTGGAGIGGGAGSNEEKIGGVGAAVTISGGTVTANGGVKKGNYGKPDTYTGAIGAGEMGNDPGILTITGGSVKLVQGTIATSTPAKNGETLLKPVTLTMGGVASTSLTWLNFPGYSYGAADVRIDGDGKVYVWLPTTEPPATVYATAGSSIYGSIASTDTEVALKKFDAEVTTLDGLNAAIAGKKAQILVSKSFTIADGITVEITGGVTITIKPGVTITNNGIIALMVGKVNYGEGYGTIAENKVAVPSTATLAVLNSSDAEIITATYGDTVTLTVTAAEKTAVAKTKGRTAIRNQAVFYLGMDNTGKVLSTEPVTYADGKATATLSMTLQDVTEIDWAIGANNLFVEFGGSGAGGLLDSTASGSLTVTAKPLTITGLTAPDRVYDGTKNINLSKSTLVGVVSGDDVTATIPTSGTVESADVGTAKPVTIKSPTLGGTHAGNYTLTPLTLRTVNIDHADQVLTWSETSEELTYTGSLAAITRTLTKTGVKSETPNGTITYTYKKNGDTTSVLGLPTNAGRYTVKASIAASGNYAAADNSADLALTITKSKPTLVIKTYTGKTYDGNLMADPTANQMTCTGANFGDVDFTYSKDASMTPLLTERPRAAGTYYVRASVGLTANTEAATSVAKEFTITKAAALVVADPANIPMVKGQERAYTFDLSTLAMPQNAGTKSYAVASPSDANLFTANPTVNADGKTLNFTSEKIDTSGGKSTVVVTITSANYKDTTVTLTFEIINQILVVISGISAAGRAYNGTAIAYTGTPIAKDGNTTVTVSGYTYTWSTAAGVALPEAPKNPGDYKLTVSVKADDMQYIGSVDVAFTINKAALTIKADDKSVLIGAAKPTYTATPDGLANGETIAGVTFTDNAVDTNTKGSFIITPAGGTISGGGNGNYNITYQTGTLTVNIDVSAIDTAIVAANIEKGKVTISDWPASSVANGTKFVTTAEMKALTDAINTATAAKSTVNTLAKAATAASALGGVVSTFKAAIKTGTHTADKITNVSNSYTKYYGDKAFTLKAKGNGKISYSSNNKKVVTVDKTKGKVTIKGTGSAVITVKSSDASKKIIINIAPKKNAIGKLAAGKKYFKVSYKKDTKATGYQICYSTSKSFKGSKTDTVKSSKTTSKTIKKLKSGKTYYVRVRAYKSAKVNGKTKQICGKWSSVKKVRVK